MGLLTHVHEGIQMNLHEQRGENHTVKEKNEQYRKIEEHEWIVRKMKTTILLLLENNLEPQGPLSI